MTSLRRLALITGLISPLALTVSCVEALSPFFPVQAAAEPRLAVVAEKEDEIVSPTQIARFMGEYDRLDTGSIEQRFLLTNRSEQALEAGKVQSTCGCTSVGFFPGDVRREKSLDPKAGTPTVKLAPGASTTLRVVLDFGRVPDGFARKFVTVYLAGETRAAATFRLDATLRTGIWSSSGGVDFDVVQAGKAARGTLEVVAGRSLFAGTAPPRLGSTNPDVTTRPVGAAEPMVDRGKPVLKQKYDVILSPKAALGMVAGSLTYATAPGKPIVRVASLRGEVLGRMSALPSTVLFGELAKGKAARETSKVTVESGAAGGAMRVSTSAPWIRAQLQMPAVPSTRAKQPKPRAGTLVVSVTAGAPSGPFEGIVTLTDASGQRLVIPVVGTVAE